MTRPEILISCPTCGGLGVLEEARSAFSVSFGNWLPDYTELECSRCCGTGTIYTTELSERQQEWFWTLTEELAEELTEEFKRKGKLNGKSAG